MKKWARILAAALLVAFALGSVVHVARAATMSLTMALVDHGVPDQAVPDLGGLHMADCDGCDPAADGHGDHLACDAVCLGPLAATLGPDGELPINAGEPLTRYAIAGLVGRTGRPEPFPPRTLV
jgi:hypothetical protein